MASYENRPLISTESAKYEKQADGLPNMSITSVSVEPLPKKCVMLTTFTFLPLFIGAIIAKFVILNTSLIDGSTLAGYSDNKTKFLPSDATGSGLLLLGLVIFSRLVMFLNFYPTIFKKTEIMPMNAGNLRANSYIYQLIGNGASSDTSVVLNNDGKVGEFNRANRSLTHFTETSPAFVACLVLSGLLYPKPIFSCIVLYCMGRVMHQIGYTNGYGSHAGGFMMSMLAQNTVDGLLLITGVEMLM